MYKHVHQLVASTNKRVFSQQYTYLNESDPCSNVHYLSSSENKAWKKNSGLYKIWTHDLCNTSAVLYQLN